MSRVGLIYQPCGLGDILFLQKVANRMLTLSHEVWWPVVSELAWLNDYIPEYNFVSWGDTEHKLTGPPLPDHVEFPRKEMYLPSSPSSQKDGLFFFQGFIDCHPVMAGKYDSINLPWKDWREFVKFDRNPEKERDLFYNRLGLSDDEEFVFVNRHYMLRPEVRVDDRISVDSDVSVVELFIEPEFTLFDWCMVLERAREIHMIETSLNYLLESPALFDTVKEKKLVLYHRNNSFAEVDYLFSLPWEYRT